MTYHNLTEHHAVREALLALLASEGLPVSQTISRLLRNREFNERQIREEILNMLTDEEVVLGTNGLLEKPITRRERVPA